uniref:Uncharacterized protein n=1 Tax=Romanomermis culicivorax TaxID=13658 RepID=A0A915KC51_ROMCU
MPDFRYCLSVAACTVLLLGFWSIYFYYRKCKKALSSEAFDGRTIIITGASSGLGRALAIELFNAATGAQLVLASRDLDSLKNLVLQLQNDDKKKLAPIVYRLDLEDNESVAKFAQDFLRDFPHGVDILINNAGEFVHLSYMSKSTWPALEICRICNLQAFNALLIETVVHFSLAYSASKHAFTAYFDSLRMELKSRNMENLRILSVGPGYLRTNLSKNALTSSGQIYGKVDATQQKGIDPNVAALLIFNDAALLGANYISPYGTTLSSILRRTRPAVPYGA